MKTNLIECLLDLCVEKSQAIQELWQYKRSRQQWDTPLKMIFSLICHSPADGAIPPAQYLSVHIFISHLLNTHIIIIQPPTLRVPTPTSITTYSVKYSPVLRPGHLTAREGKPRFHYVRLAITKQ